MLLAERVAELLSATPGDENHRDCGVIARPCLDCRQAALLDCLDQDSCGIIDFCKPCSASWRLRLWRINHIRHVREWHRAIERYPALSKLHEDQETAAAIWWELRRALGRDIRKWLERQGIRRP